MIIDATTQPGFSDTPLVELSGTANNCTNAGLYIRGGDSTVKALMINKWGDGILIETGDNNTIQGNYFGLDATGNYPQGITLMRPVPPLFSR